MCCLSILVSLMLNIFLSSHAFFAFGWLGFFGIIDVFNFWLSWGWRSSTWRISSSPSSTLGAPPSTTTLAPTLYKGSRHIAHEKQTHRPREALTWPGTLFSTVSTGQRQHRPREALHIARGKLSTSLTELNTNLT